MHRRDQAKGGKAATALAQQMLAWCPMDNIGVRFLLGDIALLQGDHRAALQEYLKGAPNSPAHWYRMVRYSDDFVVLCQNASQAQQALQEVKAWVEENGLELHPDKTHVGDCRIRGQGFEFLGYRFEAGRRWVRKKSEQGLKDKVRRATGRTSGQSLRQITESLNPVLKGWFQYFKHAHRNTFKAIDGFVRRRMRAVLRKHEKRPGAGHCREDHQRWPNAFFADLGLFTMETAWRASQSR
jgi:RNA-directed DNA polymerase